MMLTSVFMAALLSLGGVTGENLRARAFFDVNNAKVGDPLVLTIDFIGSADFAGLHPPVLDKALDRRDWKLDAASAKTDTYRDAKRLTWRVRPRREGVLWFPALTFAYLDSTGGLRKVTSNAIPVHAKPGVDVVVAEMGRDETVLPEPDALIVEPPELQTLSDDARFAWRKACAKPTADAFASFDFPAAKLNEARCATLSGDWARALRIYSRLEWTTGQTPEIERGILAALAVRYSNPLVELPVWRQVGRPLLKYDWRGRVGFVAGSVLAVTIILLALGRLVRALALVACTLLFVLPHLGRADDPFAEMDRLMREQLQQMQQMRMSFSSGGMNFGFPGGADEDIPIGARVTPSTPEPTVGEEFRFLVELDVPKNVSIGQIRLTPSESFGLQQVGQVANLPDAPSANPTNVLKRLSVPVRYDVPVRAQVGFDITGMVTSRRARTGRNSFSYSFSRNFSVRTAAVPLTVKPLSTANQPSDYAGIIASQLKFSEAIDLATPETNDVVQVTYRLEWSGGYVPADWMPEGAAFEIARDAGEDRSAFYSHVATWRRYVVADGCRVTPKVSFSWYDPRKKTYIRAEAGGTPLRYRVAKPVGNCDNTHTDKEKTQR